MKIKELIQMKKLEVTKEYEKLQKSITKSKEKLLKTEGAFLILQHLEQQLDKEA